MFGDAASVMAVISTLNCDYRRQVAERICNTQFYRSAPLSTWLFVLENILVFFFRKNRDIESLGVTERTIGGYIFFSVF